MQGVNSKVNLSPASDIIGTLQNILAQSQAIIPDLETPYSRARFPSSTNYSAIELKDQSIGDIINERQQQLDAVSHEISGLETVMGSIEILHQQLIRQKNEITQSMNLHKRLGSTLWHFPTEVLSQIFHHCLPETRFLLPPSMLNAPMLLTAICRRWREVAVGDPGLWCRLFVTVDDRDWLRAAFSYDSWFKRSRGLPLSLALKCSDNHSIMLRSLLQPYINQISSLSIIFVYGATKVELMLTDLLALEELTISIHDSYTIPAIAQSISQLPFTMRSLKVLGQWFDVQRLSSFDPVWAHLTNVEIVIRQPEYSHPLAQTMSQPLLSLIRDSRQYRTKHKPLDRFTHTKIRSLRINNTQGPRNQLSDLFNALSLPNLRVLEACNVTPWPHEALKAFLARSKCPLETLIFGAGVMATDEQRAEYVALVPSLEVVVNPKHRNY
ncbi:hypothetical protein DFH29DRAFT_1078180 [Suillus ampliporus]|nr:hypothetical protein DFH29DRAFT_1078180 [Suillus ampliporus]